MIYEEKVKDNIGYIRLKKTYLFKKTINNVNSAKSFVKQFYQRLNKLEIVFEKKEETHPFVSSTRLVNSQVYTQSYH